MFGVILSNRGLKFSLPWRDHLVIRFGGRSKIIRTIITLFMKVNVNVWHPFMIDLKPLPCLYLGAPGPVSVQIKKIMIGSSSWPWLPMFFGIAITIWWIIEILIIKIRITITSVWIYAWI